MEVTLFFGLVIMMINDVSRRNFRLAFGCEGHHGLDFIALLVSLFFTAYVLFSPPPPSDGAGLPARHCAAAVAHA